jgi:hypothetical protein
MSPSSIGGSSTMSFRDITTIGSMCDLHAVDMSISTTSTGNNKSPCNTMKSDTTASVGATTTASVAGHSSPIATDSPDGFSHTRRKSVFFADEHEHEHEHNHNTEMDTGADNSNKSIRNVSDSSRTDNTTATSNTPRSKSSAAVLQPSLNITSGNYHHEHIRSSSSTLPR